MLLSSPAPTCLGIDVSKAKLDACLFLGSHAHQQQFDNSKTGLQCLQAWCQKHGVAAPLTVLEATGRYSDLATFTLHAARHQVHVANPRRVKDYARSLGPLALCRVTPSSPQRPRRRRLARRHSSPAPIRLFPPFHCAGRPRG